MTLNSRGERLGTIGVHIGPHYTFVEEKHSIHKVADEIHACSDITWIVCGDFNFEALGERAYNADRGTFMESLSSEQLGLAWNEALSELVEHH